MVEITQLSANHLVELLGGLTLIHDTEGEVLACSPRGARLLDRLQPAWRADLPGALGRCFGLEWRGYLRALPEGLDTTCAVTTEDATLTLRLQARPIGLSTGAGGVLQLEVEDRRGISQSPREPSPEWSVLDAVSFAFYELEALRDEAGEVCDFVFVDMNPVAEAELSMGRDQVLGQKLKSLFPINEDGGFFLQYRDAFASGEGFAQQYEIPVGEPASGWYEHEVIPTDRGIFIFNHNIDALKRAELYLAHILQTLPDPVFIIDHSGIIERTNAAAERVFGYPEGALIGQSVEALMSPEHVEHHGSYVERYLRTREARIIGQPRELTAIDAQGNPFPIRLSVGAMEQHGALYFVGSMHDMRPKYRLREQLLQSQKMEALGLLAGGVAHDFNNMLMVILQNAAILEEDLPQEELHQELAGEIIDASLRAAALSQQLLQFSRAEVGHPVPLSVADSLRDFSRMARSLLSDSFRLQVQLPDDEVRVRVDPNRLTQVLLNLTVNARDAMPDGGEIRLEVRLGAGGGDRVELVFEDDGPGIPQALRDRVFEPFFTTKPQGSGTGLGLSTVFGIVRAAGGEIALEEADGGGARFVVSLPRCYEAPRTLRPQALDMLPAAGAHIVLVEDDAHARRSTERSLLRAGFEVTCFPSASSAARDLPGLEPAALVTDVKMHGMSGVELVEEVRRHLPTLPVLFISGYSTELKDLPEDPRRRFLAKPFDGNALAEALRALLAAR
jgi:PAS domain S-box-containing protein